MFGIGGDDKDKLKENMEDIKQMVNNSTPGQQPPNDQESQIDDFEQKFSQETDESDTKPVDRNQQRSENTQSFSDQPQQNSEQQDLSGSQDRSFEGKFDTSDNSSQSDQNTGNQPNQNTVNEPQSSQAGGNQSSAAANQENVQAFDSSPQENNLQQESRSQSSSRPAKSSESGSTGSRLNDSIPEPAETKDIDVPEIDKGPLFIRRQKFESAKNMIEEMRYISREIEEVVNQLERGIEEDQQTEKEARELLHNLEKDRSSVKNIISQQNKQQE
ncbi:MAG: hypothetical protein ACI9LV_001016 [Candidatus Nanohaloarchaea archaeon]|jgi:hypothetical protein